MDQRRRFLAIAISLAILLGFQFLVKPHLPQPPIQHTAAVTPEKRPNATPLEGAAGQGAAPQDRRAQGAGLGQPARRADRRSRPGGLPRDARTQLAACAAAGAAFGSE